MRPVAEQSSPAVRRGFILLAIMTVCFGMAMAIQQNIVTNYFEDVLKLRDHNSDTSPRFARFPDFCSSSSRHSSIDCRSRN